MNSTDQDHADPDHADGWTAGPELTDVPDGRVTIWRPEGAAEGAHGADPQAVVLVRIGDQLAAYRNACAHQGFSLAKAILDAEGAVLTCPWHGYKYQALTGECMSAVDKRLHPFPARVDGGRVWLRLND